MDLSIVIPVMNEEASVKPLYEAVVKAMAHLNLEYEIILVDDGSTDNTYLNASQLAEKDHKLKVIKLKRNYGQTIGLHAGFQLTKGRVVVTMDGDLQNDPTDIETMVNKIDEGYDIVLGWRFNRKDSLISRKIPSKIANWLISKVTGIPVKDNGCAIRAYRGEVVKKFPMYSEMHRLMPVITALSGARFAQIVVKHHERKFGKSKYGISRIYKVLIDMVALKIIFAFFHLPLYGFGIFALISGILSLIIFSLAIIKILLNPGYSLVTIMGSGILFASLSMFLVFMGLISEMIYKNGDIKIEKLLRFKK
ncbi:MAG TPA: glycosyltransferase family 2 protein [Ignavibacteriaceae bacterium]|nr:glycosyltransferase family 2 protein [Ignavibacteriaceae bacterium]